MAKSDTIQEPAAFSVDDQHKKPVFTGITIIPGAVSCFLGLLGLVGMYFGIAVFRSIFPGYQTMAFSTSVLLFLFGLILAAGSIRPFKPRTSLGIQIAMIFIVVIEVIELPFNIRGDHFIFESQLVGIGNAIAGQPTSPISPFTLILVILSSAALFLLMAGLTSLRDTRARDIAGVLGLIVALTGFTLILSYLYGAPLTYGAGLIPVAAPTALAFLAVGIGVVTGAGQEAVPLRYFSGDSIRVLLLRTFLPLTIVVILAGTGIEITLRFFSGQFNAVLTGASIVIFCLITGLIVYRVSGQVGNVIETARREQRKAEEDLRTKNTELEAAFEEITATEEELRQNYDELIKSQREQQRAEEEIKRANAYNRSLIEASLDPLVTINLDGTINDVNEATINVTGLSREGLIGTDFSNYFNEPEKAKAGYEKVFREGSVTDYELGIRHKNGRITPIFYNATVFRDEHGEVAGVFAAARDITERKKAEDAVRNANAYNRSLIEASLDPLVTINPDGTISDVNEATVNVTGFNRNELIGTDFSNYFTEPEKAKAGYKTVFRDGSVRDYELRIRNRNGKVIPVLYNATIYQDSEGKVTGVFAAARDITEKKRAEEALQKAHDELEERVEQRTEELRQRNEELGAVNEELTATQEELRKTNETLSGSEERYRTRFNALIEGFCVIEMVFDEAGRPVDYRFLEINDAFEAQTGLHDAQGKLMRDLAPDHEQHWFEIYGKIAVTGEPAHFENEARALNRWYEVRAFRIGGPDSRKVAVCFNDITERKKAEESLKEALSEKEVLLSEIHHRVKNNLTAFISLLSLDGSYEDTENGRALRKDLQNRARSMALIHETLYRTGKFSNVDMEVYLKNLVSQVASSYRESERIRTVVDVHGMPLDISRATTAGLIINELVTNSFKYAFPPGFDCVGVRGEPCIIRVSFAHEDGRDVLRVADNGCGLHEGFDPFTTKSLGLKLVNFLARHQLRADIEVRMDKGTEFTFRLKNTGDNA